MAIWEQPDPRWIDAVLNWSWTWFFARVALCGAFVAGGLEKVINYAAATAEQARFGLKPAWLWAAGAILIELGGSLLVISDHLVWLGAGAMAGLTAIAMLVADDFWNKARIDRFAAFNTFLEHLGLIGGLVSIAVIAAHKNWHIEP